MSAPVTASQSQGTAFLTEEDVAQMTLPQLLDPVQRFEILRLCWEVLLSYDPIRGATLFRTFAKHRESPEAGQLSPEDLAALDELYAWSIIASCEAQPNEVVAEALSTWALLLLHDGVDLRGRLEHCFTVVGEMDGTIIYRHYLLQALQRNAELLGTPDLEVPGEASVKPTVGHWIAAYDRVVRRESRSSIDRLQFLQGFAPAKELSREDRQVLLSLLELADDLAAKPTTIGGLFPTALGQVSGVAQSKQVLEQYLASPFSREIIQEAQTRLSALRRQGKDLLTLLDQAVAERSSTDVVAILFLFARERRLGALLHDPDFQRRFEPLVGTNDEPKALLKAVLLNAIGDENGSAQLGAQLANLLVAGGERDYLGLAVFAQRTGRYEWRV